MRHYSRGRSKGKDKVKGKDRGKSRGKGSGESLLQCVTVASVSVSVAGRDSGDDDDDDEEEEDNDDDDDDDYDDDDDDDDADDDDDGDDDSGGSGDGGDDDDFKISPGAREALKLIYSRSSRLTFSVELSTLVSRGSTSSPKYSLYATEPVGLVGLAGLASPMPMSLLCPWPAVPSFISDSVSVRTFKEELVGCVIVGSLIWSAMSSALVETCRLSPSPCSSPSPAAKCAVRPPSVLPCASTVT